MPNKSQPGDHSFRYEGFSVPNGTFVPDDLFDLLAPRLTEAELRVLLYVIRRTFGFGKNADAISLKQLTDGITTRDGRTLDHGTGMSRKGVIAGIKGLLDKQIITVSKQLDDRGENQVNVYTLRFKEGVVTKGNYRSNPNTLPGVTFGNPQESALQEAVIQDTDQQQPGVSIAAATSQPNAASVVVSSREQDPSCGRPDLYDALRELGVHHHTAGKLLRECAVDDIEQMVGFVAARLQKGWTPQESVAGWLVAAIRNHYQLPVGFKSQAMLAEDQARLEQQRSLGVEADRVEAQRVDEELRRQRLGKLIALGIEQNTDKVWQDTQALLRQRQQWSVAMSMCFLKSVEQGLAILLVPASVKRRLQPHHEALTAALQEVQEQPLRLVMHEIGS